MEDKTCAASAAGAAASALRAARRLADAVEQRGAQPVGVVGIALDEGAHLAALADQVLTLWTRARDAVHLHEHLLAPLLGEFLGFAKVTRDLTERKQAQERALADAGGGEPRHRPVRALPGSS